MNVNSTPVKFMASDRQITKQLKAEKKAEKKTYKASEVGQKERLAKKARRKTYAKDYTAFNAPMVLGTTAATLLFGPVGLVGLVAGLGNVFKMAADEGDNIDYRFNTSRRANRAERDVLDNYDRIKAEIEEQETEGKQALDLSSNDRY